MKQIIASLIFLFGFGYLIQDETVYNVYEYEMVLEREPISSVYYTNEKCYTIKKFKHWHDQHNYYLRIEDVLIKFSIMDVRTPPSMTCYIASRNSNPYNIREFTREGHEYVVVTPMRFNSKFAIDDSGLVISTAEVCKVS